MLALRKQQIKVCAWLDNLPKSASLAVWHTCRGIGNAEGETGVAQ